ncbi:MAG: helix-turn-helix domain containing protein [Clostridiales bacterium]|nr:helix-turn-helix domain containing protein [Clostridiales bacterium]
MPPKPKFTREEIVDAALSIVSERGVDALTARELGERLGSSARPVFTVFKNMEEVQAEVRAAAMRRFEVITPADEDGDMPLFKQVGVRMVRFGLQEPKLYQLLFMQENRGADSFDGVFSALGTAADLCIDVLCRDYALSRAEARALFETVWIYTFGVGALCATGVCRFSEERLSQMLTTEFQAMLTLVKSGVLKA